MVYTLTNHRFEMLNNLFVGEVLGNIDFLFTSFNDDEREMIIYKLIEDADWEENSYCYFVALKTINNFLKITPLGDFGDNELDAAIEAVRDMIKPEYSTKFLLEWLACDGDHIKIINEVISEKELFKMDEIMAESFYRYEERISTIVFNMLKFYLGR